MLVRYTAYMHRNTYPPVGIRDRECCHLARRVSPPSNAPYRQKILSPKRTALNYLGSFSSPCKAPAAVDIRDSRCHRHGHWGSPPRCRTWYKRTKTFIILCDQLSLASRRFVALCECRNAHSRVRPKSTSLWSGMHDRQAASPSTLPSSSCRSMTNQISNAGQDPL